MSGSSVQRLRLVNQADASYNSVMEVLGAKDLSPKEQIRTLLDATREDYSVKIGRRFPIGPLVDGIKIPALTSYKALANPGETNELLPGLRQCKRILMGDCQMDVSPFVPVEMNIAHIFDQEHVMMLKKNTFRVWPSAAAL